jgi:1-acyl-sn-glycerol-3-phosphate acyltransferase
MRACMRVAVRLLFDVRLVDRDRLPNGPAVLCFNHLGWLDPIVLLGVLPMRPRLYLFGPREEDMHVGFRNRLMHWSGSAVPFRPDKADLLGITRRVEAVFESGALLGIAGEGRIHVHEGDLMRLQEGTAFFALRGGVPIVPIAITGTSWVSWRCRILIRVGEPIAVSGRATRDAVDASTARVWHALHALLAGDSDLPAPGRFGRWLTETFNDWGPGGREAAAAEWGPSPPEVPLPPA